MTITVLPPWSKTDLYRVDVTSRGTEFKQLSPFFLGPVRLFGTETSRNVENGWQYSKVYEGQVGPDGEPTPQWWDWARAGWAKTRADRYPAGKGARPAYSYWGGEHLGYIEARKRVYVPLYANAVYEERGLISALRELYCVMDFVITDFDAYDHRALGMSFTDVLNHPTRKMGHGFVLAMMLEEDEALDDLL